VVAPAGTVAVMYVGVITGFCAGTPLK
jgi:hypothetical protein